MKRLKVLFLTGAVGAALMLTGCGSTTEAPTQPTPTQPTAAPSPPKPTPPQPTPPPAPPVPAGDPISKGKAIYMGAGNCASCHGQSGKPTVTLAGIPNFTDAAWQRRERDAELAASIKNGKKLMPKYEGPETDIPALVAYIRTFAGPAAAPPPPTPPPSKPMPPPGTPPKPGKGGKTAAKNDQQ